MRATTIKEVIEQLASIIKDCQNTQSKLGYFAILYRDMTVAIEEGIAAGAFEDGKRMEALDVHFANRYLDAYYAYQQQQELTTSWKIAFDAANRADISIIQHLLLGINAHINLDLGVSVASVTTIETIEDMKKDFDTINVVIAQVYARFQQKLKRISWLAMFIKDIDPKRSDAVINFSISKARDLSWSQAKLLVETNDNEDAYIVKQADAVVAGVALRIQQPGTITKWILGWMIKAERKDVTANLNHLLS